MSPDDLRYLRGVFGLSQRDLAQALGVAPFTVARWETGASTPTGLPLEVLRGLQNTARRVEHDGRQRTIVAGLIGLGIGAVLFHLLTRDTPAPAPSGEGTPKSRRAAPKRRRGG